MQEQPKRHMLDETANGAWQCLSVNHGTTHTTNL